MADGGAGGQGTRNEGLAQRLRRHALRGALVPVLLLFGLGWGFVELADEVIEGGTHAFDTRLLLMMRNPADTEDPLGPAWVEELGRDFTALGGVGVLTLLTAAVAGLLWLQGRWRSMWLVLGAVGGGILLSTAIKRGFDRPRPELVPYDSAVYTASFPSGHSMMAAVTYLTLAVMLARVQRRRALKVYLVVAAALLTVLVGVSRVYVGVHWPTDVLAGWTAGAAWALICALLAEWLQRRHAIEPEEDEDAPPTADRPPR